MDRKILINLLVVALLVGGIVTGIFAIRQATSYLSQAQTGLGQPDGVSSRVVSHDQAVISWTTQEEVISLILYGTGPTSLDKTQTELSSAKTHRITLTNLDPDTTYYYKIQVGQEIFDESGQPWTFSTPEMNETPKLSKDEFKKAYGTTDLRFDMNKDGAVNGVDYQLYLDETRKPTGQQTVNE